MLRFLPFVLYRKGEGVNLEFIDYSLKVGHTWLIEGLNISFEKNVMNHLLGSNGSGKSCFAKSCAGMLKSKGRIVGKEETVLLGSGSNIPSAFHLPDVVKLLLKRFEESRVLELYKLLKLHEASQSLPIRKMSDGQKQKIKLLSFLSGSPKVILLDEFTSALDQRSSLDLYEFLRGYISENDITFLNITHNLSDIEYLPGNYYYLHHRNIIQIATKEEIINAYVRGGLDDGS